MSRNHFDYIWQYFHILYEGDKTTNNANDNEDDINELFDNFWRMEMEGYKKDDQDNSNKDGMEEDVDPGGSDIPDQALAAFTNGTDNNHNDIADDDAV